MNLTLYIDTTNKRFVTGPTNATPFTPPPMFQGGKLNLKIYLLEVNASGGLTTPYTTLTITGNKLRVALGNPQGANTPIAFQDSFLDSGNTFFTGTLNLNTIEIDAFLGNELSKSTYLEIDVAATSGDQPDKIIQIPVTLNASLLPVSGTTPTPSQTPLPYLMMSDANGVRYMLTIIDGQITIQSLT